MKSLRRLAAAVSGSAAVGAALALYARGFALARDLIAAIAENAAIAFRATAVPY